METKEMAKEVPEQDCLRCEVLLQEIAIKNEIVERLTDRNLDLAERVSQLEWAMGI